jgi:hypothetical protein
MAVLKRIKISEISAARKPAQEFALVKIMKSADNIPETGDIAVSEIRKMLDDGDFDGYAKSDYTEMLNTLSKASKRTASPSKRLSLARSKRRQAMRFSNC